jgi:CheY-like chemotaxis protein
MVSFAEMPKTADKRFEQVLEILPDLIILDLSMPVDGLDAAPELKKILPDCPIILYTLFADTLVQSSDVEARGITRVVAKDHSLDSLIDRANELFSERDRG